MKIKIIDFKDKTWQVAKMFWFVHLCQFCLYHLHWTPQLYPVSKSFESFISHRVGGSLTTFLNFLRLQLTCPIMLIVYGNKMCNSSIWLCIACTLHSAVTKPGRLLQQPYMASIGCTSPGRRVIQWSQTSSSVTFYLSTGLVIDCIVWREVNNI